MRVSRRNRDQLTQADSEAQPGLADDCRQRLAEETNGAKFPMSRGRSLPSSQRSLSDDPCATYTLAGRCSLPDQTRSGGAGLSVCCRSSRGMIIVWSFSPDRVEENIEMASTGTLGVDLAAQSPKTAGCMIEWDDRGQGRVHCPSDNYQDSDLFSKLIDTQYVTRAAIDAPFGWPQMFIEQIAAYQRDGVWPDAFDSNASVRGLRLRATDRWIHSQLGLTPLSVSTDRIGIVAMHCARLLAALQVELGQPVDRSGQGRILEVYPAAALRAWGISPATSDDPGSYKGDSEAARTRRHWILGQIKHHTSAWLEMHEKVTVVCVENDDCLDALICALIARAAERDLLEPIDDPGGDALSEGWIRLPQPGSLSLLGSGGIGARG
jgi:hypothetical protein